MRTDVNINGYFCRMDGWGCQTKSKKRTIWMNANFIGDYSKLFRRIRAGGFTARQNLPVSAVKAKK
jgi:hypothetical protein